MMISALIPVYNGAATLGDAIESVLRQTRPADEVIVIDDGSTDESAEIARGFAPRVKTIVEIHRGLGATRNRALAAARGEAVAFLDADDVWPAARLRVLAEALAREPSFEAVAGRVAQFLSPDLPAAERQRIRLRGGAGAAPVIPALLIKRSALARVGPFATRWKVGTDMEWLLRAREVGLVIGTVAEVVLERRIHARNTGRTQREHAAQRLEIVKAALERRRNKQRLPE